MNRIKEKVIKFNVGAEKLAGRIISPDLKTKPTLLFLHGAGTSTKERVRQLAIPLSENGISSFSFDYSGRGDSSGLHEKSSLEKRTLESIAALKYLDSSKLKTVCGSSMGGHIALELLNTEKIDCIILFCPAIYSTKAFSVPFDSRFTHIIREPESWRNSDVFSKLDEFTGKLLIIIGDNDEVIPQSVIDLLDKHSKKTSKKEIFNLPGCPHDINSWLLTNPEYKDLIITKIIEFHNA